MFCRGRLLPPAKQRRTLSSIVRNRIALIFPTPIRSLGTKWSRMQNKPHPSASRCGSCVRTSQREPSHSAVLAARVGNARGERHGCMLVSRDDRRDRKTVLVRSASAATRKALQRQALGAAGAAAAIAADGACVIAPSIGLWRAGSTPLVKRRSAPISSIPIRSSGTKWSRSWNKGGREPRSPSRR